MYCNLLNSRVWAAGDDSETAETESERWNPGSGVTAERTATLDFIAHRQPPAPREVGDGNLTRSPIAPSSACTCALVFFSFFLPPHPFFFSFSRHLLYVCVLFFHVTETFQREMK